MLIVSNGAFKSGSTWLFVLLRSILNPAEIPEQFRVDSDWNGQTIAEERLAEFLRLVDCFRQTYVVKSHWQNEATLQTLLNHDQVLVLDIVRDLRDVLVSAYYHYQRLQQFSGSFADFYRARGAELIWHITAHHHLWRSRPGKVHVASYEALLNDFQQEVEKIFRFLCMPVVPGLVDRLRDATRLDSLRRWWNETDKTESERFFRKGTIGDWVNHFTAEISADFNQVAACARQNFSNLPTDC